MSKHNERNAGAKLKGDERMIQKSYRIEPAEFDKFKDIVGNTSEAIRAFVKGVVRNEICVKNGKNIK
jgi:hypothetical protein